MAFQRNDISWKTFRDAYGIEDDLRRIKSAFKPPRNGKLEKRSYYFLADFDYSAALSNEAQFNVFKSICLRFKALGGRLLYTNNIESIRNGTIFIDDFIPEEKRDEAKDLFEGFPTQTIELTILQPETQP